MGDAKVQQSPRINRKKGGIVPSDFFDFKKLIKDLIVCVGYRLVDEYNAFTISRYGPMNYQRRLRRTKFYLLNLMGEGKSRPIPRTDSIIIVSSLHLFCHGKMDHVLIKEYREKYSLGLYLKKVNLVHIKLRIEIA
jgi:hypothetical protein